MRLSKMALWRRYVNRPPAIERALTEQDQVRALLIDALRLARKIGFSRVEITEFVYRTCGVEALAPGIDFKRDFYYAVLNLDVHLTFDWLWSALLASWMHENGRGIYMNEGAATAIIRCISKNPTWQPNQNYSLPVVAVPLAEAMHKLGWSVRSFTDTSIFKEA